MPNPFTGEPYGDTGSAPGGEVSPPSASLALVAISPDVSGGVEAVIPAVALLALAAVSPAATGGVPALVPEVAVLTLLALAPAVLPSVQVRAAILGVFNFEPAVQADEWSSEPAAIGSFGF